MYTQVGAIITQPLSDDEGFIKNRTGTFFQFILSLIRVSGGKIKVKEECVKMSINSELLLDEIPEFFYQDPPGLNHHQVGDQSNYKHPYSAE